LNASHPIPSRRSTPISYSQSGANVAVGNCRD
jgi:hypothetical protein